MAKEQSPWAKRAAAVRGDIAAAVKAGAVKLPEGARVSVRADSFSMGSSIDVVLRGAAQSWLWATTGDRPGDWSLSADARALGADLAEILSRHNDTSWGSVTTEDGTTLGSVAKAGWTPGQD